MKALIRPLWPLYLDLDLKQMSDLCPNAPTGLIPVYDEGTGIVQDEEGNEISEDISRRRSPGLKRGKRILILTR